MYVYLFYVKYYVHKRLVNKIVGIKIWKAKRSFVARTILLCSLNQRQCIERYATPELPWAKLNIQGTIQGCLYTILTRLRFSKGCITLVQYVIDYSNRVQYIGSEILKKTLYKAFVN